MIRSLSHHIHYNLPTGESNNERFIAISTYKSDSVDDVDIVMLDQKKKLFYNVTVSEEFLADFQVLLSKYHKDI